MQVIRHPIFVQTAVIVNPISNPVFTCGFECASSGTSGGDAHLTVGSNASFSTSTVRTGNRSLRINLPSSDDSSNFLGAATTRNIIVGRIYIRFATLPNANILLFWVRDVNQGIFTEHYGIGWQQSSGTLRTARNNGGVMSFGTNGVTPITGVWYRLDLKVTGGLSAPITVDGQIDGSVLNQLTNPVTDTITAPACGALNNAQGEWFYDDAIISIASVDYPIGAGYVDLYVPTSDGTHNVAGANQFERGTTGTDITNATTNAYELVDEVPLNSVGSVPPTDDYITAIAPANATDYVEMKFGTAPGFSAPTKPPRAVESVVAVHQATTTTGNFRVALNDNGTVSDVANRTEAGQTTIRHFAKHFGSDPPSAATEWNISSGNGNFLNLRARFYSSDADPDQSLDGVAIEAEFEP